MLTKELKKKNYIIFIQLEYDDGEYHKVQSIKTKTTDLLLRSC